METPTATVNSAIAPRNAMELKLCRIWERLLKVSGIGVHDDFFKLGGDSISAMSLLAVVAQETGYPLPAGGLLQAPTIATLAASLILDLDPGSWSPMVPIQREGTRQPIFCIHPGGGSVLCYLKLSRNLGNDQPFYALQAPGVDGIRSPLRTVEEMAAEYVAAIRLIQPEGPYSITGWSAGGVIAFEVAQQLLASGQEVSHMGIIDSGVLYTIGILKAMSPKDQPGIFEMMRRTPSQRIQTFRIRSAAAKLIPDEADDDMAIQIMELFKINVQAVASYRPQPYTGRVDLYQAEQSLVIKRRQPYAEWTNVCADLHLHTVPGNHLTMIHEPNVQSLAQAIARVHSEIQGSLGNTVKPAR